MSNQSVQRIRGESAGSIWFLIIPLMALCAVPCLAKKLLLVIPVNHLLYCGPPVLNLMSWGESEFTFTPSWQLEIQPNSCPPDPVRVPLCSSVRNNCGNQHSCIVQLFPDVSPDVVSSVKVLSSPSGPSLLSGHPTSSRPGYISLKMALVLTKGPLEKLRFDSSQSSVCVFLWFDSKTTFS